MSVYVTVDYYARDRRDRPLCEGCTPTNASPASKEWRTPAALRLIGASGGMDLCTACAVDSIKSIAARFMLHDSASTRELMNFFAIEAARPRRRVPTAKAIAPPVGEVDVLPRGARVPRKKLP